MTKDEDEAEESHELTDSERVLLTKSLILFVRSMDACGIPPEDNPHRYDLLTVIQKLGLSEFYLRLSTDPRGPKIHAVDLQKANKAQRN